MNEKDKYIKLISGLSDKFGDKLLDCMEKNNVTNLHEINVQDLKEYYESIKQDCPAVNEIGDKKKINDWCKQSKYIPKSEQTKHCKACLLHAKMQENEKTYEIN